MILTDEHTAVMERVDFESLLDYSCSLPTGFRVGKRWKRRRDYYDESKGWLMGEDFETPDGQAMCRWRAIEVVA